MSASPSFFEIARFEWRQQWRAPLLWITLLGFAGLAFAFASTDAVSIGGADGNVLRNAPMVIVRLLNVSSVLSILLAVLFVASAALRDFDQRTAELLFAMPLSRGAYLGGRFATGYLIVLMISVGCMGGLALGGAMPWLDPAQIGPTEWRGYAWGMLVLVLPNMLIIASALFLLACITRSRLVSYLGVVGWFTLQGISGYLSHNTHSHVLIAALDPFGIRTLNMVTRYWSAEQTNHLLPALDGLLLLNRLLWLGVALLMLGAACLLFRPGHEGLRLPRRSLFARSRIPANKASAITPAMPTVTLHHDWRAHLQQLRAQCSLDTAWVLKGVPALVLLLMAVCLMLIGLNNDGLEYGTPLLPVTHHVAETVNDSFTVPLMLIIILYAGELVWRERDQHSAELSDAFPVPEWVPLLAQFGALLAFILLMLLAGTLVGVGWQLSHGYKHLQPGLYLGMLALHAIPFVLAAALALFLQVLANNKFLGYLLTIAWLGLSTIGFGLLHWEQHLYNYGTAPDAPYSDLNGFGHFLKGVLWFDFYWAACAVVLLQIAALLWVRGTDQPWRERLREARARLHAPGSVALSVSLLAFIGSGGWIYYNTNVLNQFTSSTALKVEQANYEKKYARYEDAAQPRITAVQANVDIYPYHRKLDIRGHYTLVNKHATPISELYVNFDNDFSVKSLQFAPHSIVSSDKTLGFTIYKLNTPLAPGASMPFDFTLAYAPKGFSNSPSDKFLARNGTFFNNSVMPQFGYEPQVQLTDRNDRRKYGLKVDVPRMPPLGDRKARANTYISNDADWVSFDTTVSTAADQIALAPGALQKTWTARGRRYFHYKMQRPMQNFFAYLSARYAVKCVNHDGVAISVYYNPAHAWNVDRLIESASDSLDYYDSHYTPYQFKQLRIAEFPDYAKFAQSFANTIPFSESIGFIADLRDSSKLDYVYAVTAHEVAHQWWAHRVIGADMQGSTMLSESLAEYSSLMVMQHKYGSFRASQLLRYERTRYLAGRANEKVAEEPLAKVESDQPYIYYGKGAMAFYALQDYVGQTKLDAMLKQFLLDKGFQQPPYTNSQEFMDALSKALAPKWQPLLDDLFWKITLFDNHITAATAKKLPDGRYQVRVHVHAGMFFVDGKGKRTPAKLNLPIDIGVIASPYWCSGTCGNFARVRLPDGDGDNTVTMTVNFKPGTAEIDPKHELINISGSDQQRPVTLH